MLLVIDVGNSNTVFGLYEPGSDELVDHWRAATEARRTADEWLVLISQFLNTRSLATSDVDAVVVASVVGRVTAALRGTCARMQIEPLVVDWSTPIGMQILIDDPREIGADRIVNALAAFAITNGPSIVVDLGTATTLDVVSGRGDYLGGVIMPGIEISLDALFQRASALKPVELKVPEKVVGTSTIKSVQSGALYGYAAQIDGLCEYIEKEVGPCTVLSTGGLSGLISPLSQRITQHEPWLTLAGLRIAHQRINSGTNND